MFMLLGWTLLHSLWQIAIIAVLVFLLNLGIKSAQLRYIFACMGLCMMLLAPVVTFGFLQTPSVSATQPLMAQLEPPKVAPITQENSAASPLETIPASLKARDINMPAPSSFTFDRAALQKYLKPMLPYAAVFWLVGVALLSLRLLFQCFYAERFKRKHTTLVKAELQKLLQNIALRLRVSRPVRLLESSRVDVPTVIGFLKPVILLPTSTLMGLTTEQLESILAHELAHIRRHDYLVNLLQSLVETLLFYHPAVWWISGQIRLEREHCCDDVAVSASANPLIYAKALERLESLRHEPKLGLAANGGNLMKRIKRILGRPERSSNWFVGVVLFSLMLVFTLFISTQNVDAQTSDDYQKQIWISVIGPDGIIYTPELSGMSSRSEVIFEERENGNSKKLVITKPSTNLAYSYTENDIELPVDESVLSWYQEIWKLPVWDIVKDVNFSENMNWMPLWGRYTMSEVDDAKLIEAFGSIDDGSTYISYIRDPLSTFPISMRDVYKEPNFSAYEYILQLNHALNHFLLRDVNTDSGNRNRIRDNMLKPLITHLLENVPLTNRDLEAMFPLIDAVKTPKVKKELLLKYLNKVSSRGDKELEQQAAQMIAESSSDLICDSLELNEYVGATCTDNLLQVQATLEPEKLGSPAQEESKEIRLTIVGDLKIDVTNNDVKGSLDDGLFAIFEEVTASKRQAALLNLKGLSWAFRGSFQTAALELEGTATLDVEGQSDSLALNDSSIVGLEYLTNPIFSYNEGKMPSVKADKIEADSDKLEPWLQEDMQKIGMKFLELADENLPFNGVTGVLEDGTKYSILIVKNPDDFSYHFSTMSADKESRLQLLEQAYTYGVIPDDEYRLLLKQQSMNNGVLEYVSNNLDTNSIYSLGFDSVININDAKSSSPAHR